MTQRTERRRTDGRRDRRYARPALAPGRARRGDSDRAGIALLGFASDAGVHRNHGRTGAADGPRTLRRALANLAWHGGDDSRLYDAGNVACTGDRLEDAQAAYAGASRSCCAKVTSHWPRRRT